MATRIQMKRGTAASWAAANPILSDGEIGFETDTSKIKIGNGTSTWTALNYFPADWTSITSKPAVIASGATQLEARTAIGLSNVDNTADADKNVLSASKLTTARTINGVAFDGTQNITIASGITRVSGTVTTPTTLPAQSSTDYIYFLSGVAAAPETNTLISGDPHWNNVSTLLQFNSPDGTTGATALTDSSPNPDTWVNSAGTVKTTYAKFGNASLFVPGAWGSDMRTTNTSSKFNVSGIAFTIELWIYLSGDGWGCVFNFVGGVGGYSPVQTYVVDGRRIRLQVANAAFNAWGATISGPLMSLNSWHHVAVTGNGSTVSMFIDGVREVTTPQPAWPSADRYFSIGTLYPDYLQGGTVYLDEVRFTKGVNRYPSNFNASTIGISPTVAPSYNTVPAISGTKGDVTLPTAIGNSSSYTLKNVFSESLTISATGTQTIEGSSSVTIAPNYSYTLVSDSQNWRIV